MKNIVILALSLVCYLHANAQKDSIQLLPDQNPNFQKSRTKYMEQSVTLTQNQGLTIQQTYKAIDDMQAKKERKELAATRRQERRLLRIQTRGYGRNNYYNQGYYNSYGNNGYNSYGNGYNNFGNGYNNFGNGFNNYGYNNYNNNYGYNPFGYNGPRFLGGPTFSAVNSSLNTALLGLTLWHILRH